MSYILGVNAYHGDSSACLLKDGIMIASVEEERFRRIKHWAGFPSESIRYCMQEAGIGIDMVEHIAINTNPKANLLKKISYTLFKWPDFRLVLERLRVSRERLSIKDELVRVFPGMKINAKFHNVEHHMAHLASSFHVSPYEEAVVLSVDGFGDFASTAYGVAHDRNIIIDDRVFFPHSLGIFYQAMTQYLGFANYGDEYKVMGLAPYGDMQFMDEMRKMVLLQDDGSFRLNLDYFVHHKRNIMSEWNNCEPLVGCLFDKAVEGLLGPARQKSDKLTQRHKNIARSVQAMYEKAFFCLLNNLHKKYGLDSLCLSGGCAMNSVANGKIFNNTPFRNVYIQPAAGDAGGANGAAFFVWHQELNYPRSFVLEKPYLGPGFNDDEIKRSLENHQSDFEDGECQIEKVEDSERLCQITAKSISEGMVVGWFQGRMEWGPRALGNRSIVCDPRRSDMKDILNLKIKRRESFRPFAPSIHIEATNEYFETDYPVPFMQKVFMVKPEKRDIIPVVTHVDGTGRLQTVEQKDNPLYWQLIEEFRKITGVPVLLNTSFNENEPIVCHPEEALKCFLRTKMDVLVLGSFYINRIS